MTAATIAPAVLVRDGHAALHVAMDRPDRAALAAEIIALGEALSVCEDIDACAFGWEALWPHLRGEADPDEAALMRAAEDVENATGALIAAMAAKSGTESNETNKTETTGVAS